MLPDNSQDSKMARWLQARKDLVWLLAEAKATKQKISEKILRDLSPTFYPNEEKVVGNALSKRLQ